MSFYLDTSVLVPLIVEEPKSAPLEDWLRSIDAPVHVGDLAAAEFGAVISREVRTAALTDYEAAMVFARFDGWRAAFAEAVEIASADLRLAARLVREPYPKLLTADAIHIATCQRLGLTLVAHDEDMLTIAERSGVASHYPA